MSKYNALWEYVQKNGSQSFRLTFEEIQDFASISIDHSFLNYKRTDGIRLSGRQDFPERTDLAGILKTEFSGIKLYHMAKSACGNRQPDGETVEPLKP